MQTLRDPGNHIDDIVPGPPLEEALLRDIVGHARTCLVDSQHAVFKMTHNNAACILAYTCTAAVTRMVLSKKYRVDEKNKLSILSEYVNKTED